MSYAISTPSIDGDGHQSGGVMPVTPHDTWRAIASRSLAVRMPQNSKPYWWAAVWASIETSDAGHRHRVEALRKPPPTCDPPGDVGQRRRDVVEEAHTDLLEATVALVGGQVHHPEHRSVVVPERQDAVHQRQRGLEGLRRSRSRPR